MSHINTLTTQLISKVISQHFYLQTFFSHLHVAKDLLNQEVSSLGLHGPISSEASVETTTLALRCLAHLFTWVPLTTVISPRLLASVFHFAGLAIPEVSRCFILY